MLTATPRRAIRLLGAPSLLGALLGLGVLGSPSSAVAQLVAPFNTRITVDNQYVTGATGATDIAWASDGRAVVTTKGGTIVIRQTNGMTIQRTNVFSGVSQTAEQGLLGVVADPMVANTFYFYVSNGPNDDKHRVMKAVLGTDNNFTVDMTPIIAASRNLGGGLQGPANHNGGGLAIYQNRLYVGVGDTGANATPPTNKYSSCLNHPNGKILRVQMDGTIPSDNPLSNVATVTSCGDDGRTGGAWTTAAPDRRVFAWGFRNPWRFWVDPTSGRLWVGDVGETTREEISTGTGDAHFGYPFFEGNQDWSMSGGMLRLQKSCNTEFLPGRPCTPAVHDYPRSGTGGGTCVTGGLIPDGCGWNTALGGMPMYLFADYNADWIHGLAVTNRAMGQASSTATNVGSFSNSGPVSFRMGPDESMYVVMNQGNGVYRFTPTDRTGCAMGGMGGMGGSGGSPVGGAGVGGVAAGAGGASGAGGSGVAGNGGGVVGGQGGSPGGTGAGGATAGTGVTAGSSGTATTGGGSGMATGGAAPVGGAAPTGGIPGGAGVPAAGADGGGSDDPAGCGCRTAKSGSAAYLALAAGLALAFGARLRRRRRSE
jgi:glucose/arabinose dehydrogenase